MKILITFLLFFNLFNLIAQDIHLFPFKVDNLYGLRNGSGKVIFEPQFDKAFESRFGKSSVEINGKKGIVTYKGNWLFHCTYDYLGLYKNEGKSSHNVVIGIANKFGIINKSENILIEPKYDTLYKKYNSVIVKRKSNFGVFSLDNDLITSTLRIPIKYDTVFSYTIGKEIIHEAKKKNKTYIFNTNFEQVDIAYINNLRAKRKKKLDAQRKKMEERFANQDLISTDYEYFNESKKKNSKTIYDVVSKSPQFPGGAQKMQNFITQNLTYPAEALSENIQGTVWVEFVVNKDGTIEQEKIIKGVKKPLNNEAIRIVKSMPNWTPGEQSGKKVNVRYTIPIKFRIK